MKAEITDGKALKAVPPGALSSYASSTGWQASEKFGKHSTVYVKSGAPRLLVPNTAVILDYADAVASYIELVSRVEGRDQIAVYRDLLRTDEDVIRIRAPEVGRDGSVWIEDGVTLFENARDMMLAAACAARDPRRAYRLRSHKEAQQYLDGVRLGQTEQGSYVVTLLSPISTARTVSSDLLGEQHRPEPFERMVTRTLLKSVTKAHRAARLSREADPRAVFERAVGAGVNANLCDALAGLIEGGSGLEFSIRWARTIPAPPEAQRVTFAQWEAGALRRAADYLRSSATHADECLEGYVRSLGRDQDESDGRITLKAVVEGRLASVKVDLSRAQYRVALAAHSSRQSVSIRGDLQKQGQRWYLLSPRDLRVIEEAEDLLG
jgi:hypothetical protein